MNIHKLWLFVDADDTSKVLFSCGDPSALPTGSSSIVHMDTDDYEIVSKGLWYTDAKQIHEAKEEEKQLKQLKRKMHYDDPTKEGVEKLLSEVHYFEYQDVRIRKIEPKTKMELVHSAGSDGAEGEIENLN